MKEKRTSDFLLAYIIYPVTKSFPPLTFINFYKMVSPFFHVIYIKKFDILPVMLI